MMAVHLMAQDGNFTVILQHSAQGFDCVAFL